MHNSWVHIVFSIGPHGGVHSNGNRAFTRLWQSSPVMFNSLTNVTIFLLKPRAVNTAGKGAESLAVSSVARTNTTALGPALNSVSIVSHNATPTIANIGDSIFPTPTINDTIATAIVPFQSGGGGYTSSARGISTITTRHSNPQSARQRAAVPVLSRSLSNGAIALRSRTVVQATVALQRNAQSVG